jgi:outer membrane protein assembly factor BamE (lipoprotein component of BamABCDE complex)
MIRFTAILSLILVLPGCFSTRSTVNQKLSPEVAAQIGPGTPATEVVELLGAPTDIVQLGHRVAYLYEFEQSKMTGFLAMVVGFMNSDTRSDRVWIFLGPGGTTVSHVASSFDADKAKNGMPWSELDEE